MAPTCDSDTTDIPEFPLFTPSEPEVAFGADTSRYYGPRGWDAAKSPCNEIASRLPAEKQAFLDMFHGGAGLLGAGYRVKPSLDEATVMRALTALSRSWGVSHQQKMGTMALAIHHWCEPIPAAEQDA